ncbi:MAG: hypothetical protein M1834_004831 [Cirrosporium novae-zelandiae]|nr:MAG: hypothetical protein M1834_004831 [Cirrosporium novae-zelandiae]
MDIFRAAKRKSWDVRRERPSSGGSSGSKPVHLDVEMESPPITFYGTPQRSSGALLSGQVKLSVEETSVTLQKFEMRFVAKVTAKKPVEKNCPDCVSKTTELKKWDFLTADLPLQHGLHQFPFSYLMPGHLPASTSSALALVEYVLVANATTTTGVELKYEHVLNVKRAVLPGPEKSSVRIFPPTNLTARVMLQPVIHPIGTFPVEMTVSGVVDRGKDTQNRWRLKRLSWKIEENTKMISPACPKHAHKIGGDGKGVSHTFSREIGSDELKSGWKTDFDTPGGQIDMEFTANVRGGCNPVCDVTSDTGLEVSHVLTVELIVAEEYCPTKNSKLVTPTGAARVLRMQFHLCLTERAGLGISWDEEQPPLYTDVPASPPHYVSEEYFGPPLSPEPSYQDLDDMV